MNPQTSRHSPRTHPSGKATALPWLAAGLILAAGPAAADRVVRTDGKTLEGALVSQSATEVTILTASGQITLPRTTVREVQSTDMEPEEFEGDRLVTAGDTAGAEPAYRRALEKAKAANATAAAVRVQGKITALAKARTATVTAGMVRMLDESRRYIAEKRYDDADRALMAILPRMTGDAAATSAARRLLAENRYAMYERAGDRVDTIGQRTALEGAMTADPTFAPALLALGHILITAPTTEREGIQRLEDGLRWGGAAVSEEARARARYEIGAKYFEIAEKRSKDRSEYETAADNFLEAASAKDKFPAYADASRRAVACYEKLSESNVAIDPEAKVNKLMKALRLDPKNPVLRFQLGSTLLDQGQLPEAIEQLERTAEYSPGYKNVHRNLARAHLARKDYANALKQLDLELADRPAEYEALVQRGGVRILRNEFDAADIDLQAALNDSTQTDKTNVYLKLAELNIAREKFPEAIGNLKQVLFLIKTLNIRNERQDLEAYVKMGDVLSRQKDYDQARKWFEAVVKALEQRSRLNLETKTLKAEALTQLGSIELEQGNPRTAETQFADALKVLPDHAPAHSKIGDTNKKLAEDDKTEERANFLKKAEEAYLKAIESDPQNAEYNQSLGILYHQTIKDAKKALPYYRKYLALGGRDRANVDKWIEECTGEAAAPPPAAGDAATSASAPAATAVSPATSATPGA